MTQSFLDVHRRPTVIFNPKNPDHRRYVAEFYQKGTWGNCPVLFYSHGDCSIKSLTSDLLIEHYLNEEFPADPGLKRSKSKSKNDSGALFKVVRT